MSTRPKRKAAGRSAGARRHGRRREPPVRWGGWLVLAVTACVAGIGGVLMLKGIGFLRDVERTENLIVTGWIVVAAVSIFITVAVRMRRKH